MSDTEPLYWSKPVIGTIRYTCLFTNGVTQRTVLGIRSNFDAQPSTYTSEFDYDFSRSPSGY